MDKQQEPRYYAAHFNAEDLASEMYLYRLSTNSIIIKKNSCIKIIVNGY